MTFLIIVMMITLVILGLLYGLLFLGRREKHLPPG